MNFIFWSILFYFAYLIFKYCIKPYLRMQAYKKYEGATFMPFVPVVGAFAIAKESFQKHGDQNYFAKIFYQSYPNTRILLTNGIDKAFIMLTDPQLLKEFYQKQQFYEKDTFFIKNRVRVFGNGMAFAEGKQWAKRRKVMSQIFHFQFFNSFVPKIEKIVKEELQMLLNKNQPIQIDALKFSANIAGKTVVKSFFGIILNQKIQGQNIQIFMTNLLAKVGEQERTLRHFLFGPSILKLGLFQCDRQINRKIKIFRSLAKNIIETKLNEKQQEQNTLIKLLVDKKLINTEEGLTSDQIIQQFHTFFVAGTDTTSHLMGMLFYYLAINPNIQDKLRTEISQLKEQDINYKSIMNLKYLQAVIKETFRHYDYMVSLFPRIAIKDNNLAQITIKKGQPYLQLRDIIMPGFSVLNYWTKYFPKPFDFNPERWIQNQKQDLTYVFLPFSIGSRGCIGKNFALLQTKITTYMVLSKFNLELKQGYVHKLKAFALYEPVNPVILKLKPLQRK